MWKKLQSLLFEEEDEIEIEEKEEIKENPSKSSVIAQMNPNLANEKSDNLKIEAIEDNELNDFLDESPNIEIKPKSFGISIDDQKPKEKEVFNYRSIYEFHPVISPMFGETESKVKNTEPRIVTEAPQTLPRSVINTVISPIYGDLEMKRQPLVSANDKTVFSNAIKLERRFDEIEEPIDKISFKTTKSSDKLEEKSVEFEHFNLEDLMGTTQERAVEEKVDLSEDDDAHQFSLFDEN